MLNKIIALVTGKDDLERIAGKGDMVLLNSYLEERPLLIPQKPVRFLEPQDFTGESLVEQARQDAEDLSKEDFYPWVLEVDGKKRLPAFSSQEKMEIFSSRISQDINKIFSLGCVEILLDEILRGLPDIDYVDINLYSPKSWELDVKKNIEG
ncbi:MAG: hypothetical protein KAW12_09395 [Candidatus Aminicenantes bacterium]|nr:hypothetical protein [Candidatus Aminicenantes bacterium]